MTPSGRGKMQTKEKLSQKMTEVIIKLLQPSNVFETTSNGIPNEVFFVQLCEILKQNETIW